MSFSGSIIRSKVFRWASGGARLTERETPRETAANFGSLPEFVIRSDYFSCWRAQGDQQRIWWQAPSTMMLINYQLLSTLLTHRFLVLWIKLIYCTTLFWGRFIPRVSSSLRFLIFRRSFMTGSWQFLSPTSGWTNLFHCRTWSYRSKGCL